jgi:hypothetical protein
VAAAAVTVDRPRRHLPSPPVWVRGSRAPYPRPTPGKRALEAGNTNQGPSAPVDSPAPLLPWGRRPFSRSGAPYDPSQSTHEAALAQPRNPGRGDEPLDVLGPLGQERSLQFGRIAVRVPARHGAAARVIEYETALPFRPTGVLEIGRDRVAKDVEFEILRRAELDELWLQLADIEVREQ